MLTWKAKAFRYTNNMKLEEVKDKKLWNDFVSEHGPRSGSFLHSWEWGEFKYIAGEPVSRVGLFQKDKLEAVALLIETPLPYGYKYFFCPRGPVSSALWYDKDLAEVLAKQFAQEQGAMFLRFEPIAEGEAMREPGVSKSASIHPKQTLLLDLKKESEQLLKDMHQKTRYNIRLAEKKGVAVEVLGSGQFDQAWPVFEETATRDKFRLHDKEYYQKLISHGSLIRSEGQTPSKMAEKNFAARLVVARYENEIIAATIMIDFAGVRTYLHGASSNKHRNVMAPYLIHWHEIQDAAKQGYRYYDFWGVSDTNPEWKGITRFKRGFGGEEIKYPGTYDLVLNKLQYLAYGIVRRVRYGSRF